MVGRAGEGESLGGRPLSIFNGKIYVFLRVGCNYDIWMSLSLSWWISSQEGERGSKVRGVFKHILRYSVSLRRLIGSTINHTDTIDLLGYYLSTQGQSFRSNSASECRCSKHPFLEMHVRGGGRGAEGCVRGRECQASQEWIIWPKQRQPKVYGSVEMDDLIISLRLWCWRRCPFQNYSSLYCIARKVCVLSVQRHFLKKQ